jgi:ribosomal protein S18 acetylase RimI-like enzyme
MAETSGPGTGTTDVPASGIPGLRIRRLDAPADYPRMNEIANASRLAQNDGFYTNDEQFQRFYDRIEQHQHCDLARDLFLAELDGRLVAYVRAGWHDEPARRVYEPITFLDPAVSTRPIYDVLLDLAERRLAEIAERHKPGPKVARMRASEPAFVEALEARGYQPVRHSYLMVRPTLDDLPDAPMPAGLEIRDVRREDMEAIFRAEVEAFRDHWGFAEPGARERDDFFDDPIQSDTSLWRVAWDGEQVAGMVRSYIHPEQNARLGVQRGWVEHISVGRAWRRRGLARALIAASFPLLRQRGMTEGALSVDTQNESGALRVYERCGFVVVSMTSEFSRTLEDA